MKVYFITQKFMGEIMTLTPRVPKSSPNVEGNKPRICVSTSILGALCSISPNLSIECNTYIYSTDIDASKLYQPIHEVADIDYTGEMWILESETFYLHKVIRISHTTDTFRVFPCLKEQEGQYPVIINNLIFYDVRRGEYGY